MALLESIKSLFASDKLNVEAKYEVLSHAVAGTMSQFHQVRDRKTDEIFGLKLLDVDKTEQFEARFRGLEKPSEGEIAMAIVHPRVVKTIAHGVTTKGQQYILSEYVEGAVLSALILARTATLDGNRLTIIRQMAAGVGAVHEAGFIHRDVCPRNFIAARDGASVKLIDFGLSVPMKKEFMQPGNRTGTPAYLAPEIVRRRPTDHRVDIFSLGVSAYYLLTGEFPWPAVDASSKAAGKAALRHDTQAPDDILSYVPNLHPQLAAAIMQCVEVNPSDRPESAEQFLKLLRAVPGEHVE